MTTPAVLPVGFDGTSKDFLHTKVDRSGAVRGEYTTVTVPSGTADGVSVGLIPFNRGYRMLQGATQLYVGNIGAATTTIDVGYAYKTGSTGTDDPDAFASGLTTAQAGGLITFDEFAGLSWVALDDGWITVTVRTAATDAEGAVLGQVVGEYDSIIYDQVVN